MISTHVLDTSQGVPAVGIPIRLRRRQNGKWVDLEQGATNTDGRHSFKVVVEIGIYQLLFEVEEYLQSTHANHFYVRVPIVFKVEDAGRKYHVPLLLNPFGYSTYRGS